MPNETPKTGHLTTFVNYLVIGSLILVFVLLLGIVALRMKDPIVNSLNAPPPVAKKVAETDVQTWTPYENTKFTISFDTPTGWKMEDYSAFINNEGGFLAFSPIDLPCATCSYLNDGYFSLRIYNQTTDPSLYALFSEKVKRSQDGGVGFKNMTLDGKTGLLYQNTLYVENEGWIYEFSLDMNEGKTNIEESIVMKHILSTIKFPKLFN